MPNPSLRGGRQGARGPSVVLGFTSSEVIRIIVNVAEKVLIDRLELFEELAELCLDLPERLADAEPSRWPSERSCHVPLHRYDGLNPMKEERKFTQRAAVNLRKISRPLDIVKHRGFMLG